MTISLTGIPSSIAALIQDRTLERVFHDPLYPRNLFRAEAVPEMWPANVGERMVFTRAGLMPVSTKPLIPGQDPKPASYSTEQWLAEARQLGNMTPTHMPSSYVTLASTFTRDTQQLGLNASQTMDRLARDRLYQAYCSGECMITANAAIGVTSIAVDTISGFSEQLLNAQLLPVSPGNPLAISFTNTEPANAVVQAVPNDPMVPYGPGILVLRSALTAGCLARTGVLAVTRARRQRVGGGLTVDALTNTSLLTLNDIIAAVSRLRAQRVPPHADGKYHVHLGPEGEAQLFADNHWQRLHQSLPDSAAYRDLAIGTCVGCNFYRNTENPALDTVESVIAISGGAGGAILAPEIGAEIVNANGVPIRRALITGGGVQYEKYIDESKFITEAGVMGKIGEFSIVNGGVAVMNNRIRYILRAPQDVMQQVITQAWSWSGDFPIPSDRLAGDGAAFKRAIVVEFAG